MSDESFQLRLISLRPLVSFIDLNLWLWNRDFLFYFEILGTPISLFVISLPHSDHHSFSSNDHDKILLCVKIISGNSGQVWSNEREPWGGCRYKTFGHQFEFPCCLLSRQDVVFFSWCLLFLYTLTKIAKIAASSSSSSGVKKVPERNLYSILFLSNPSDYC